MKYEVKSNITCGKLIHKIVYKYLFLQIALSSSIFRESSHYCVKEECFAFQAIVPNHGLGIFAGGKPGQFGLDAFATKCLRHI